MKVGYTEFSYGYAFTENLIRASARAPAGAPIFPNLIQEAKAGYDVNINLPGKPLFFQFKLPEHMERGTAFELTKWRCSGLATPFFRISLMRRDLSNQHRCLIVLEAKHPGAVFYVAPFLKNIDTFNRSYSNAKVHENSVYLSPRGIGGLPDDRVHTIAYKAGLKTAYFCSEPRPIEALTYKEIQNLTMARLKSKTRISKTARQVREDVLSLATPAMQDAVDGIYRRVAERQSQAAEDSIGSPQRMQTVIDILVAREIARVSLGLDLVFAQPVLADPE